MVLASEWWKGEIVQHVPFPRERLHVVNNPINYGFEAKALEFPVRREPMIVLGIGIMIGAVISHILVLGVEGRLFVMALVTLVCCLGVVWIRKDELVSIIKKIKS